MDFTDFFKLNPDEVPEWDDDAVIAGFCRDSASVLRVFQTQSGSDYTSETEVTKFCDIMDDSPYKTDCSDLTDLKM